MIRPGELRWAGRMARMWERRGAYRVLVGKPEGKKLLGIPMSRREDNIKMDIRETGSERLIWLRIWTSRDSL